MIARTLAVCVVLGLAACGGEKKEEMQPVVPPNASTDVPTPAATVTASATAAPVTAPEPPKVEAAAKDAGAPPKKK